MEIVSSTITTAAVAAIYIIYNRYRNHIRNRQRTLRERVTYMLWVAAEMA